MRISDWSSDVCSSDLREPSCSCASVARTVNAISAGSVRSRIVVPSTTGSNSSATAAVGNTAASASPLSINASICGVADGGLSPVCQVGTSLSDAPLCGGELLPQEANARSQPTTQHTQTN